MVGVFSGHAKMTDALQRFGHVEAQLDCTNWLKSDTLSNGSMRYTVQYRGHEFHHSVVENCDAEQIIRVSNKTKSWTCGYLYKNVIATYVHAHFYANPDLWHFLVTLYQSNKEVTGDIIMDSDVL